MQNFSHILPLIPGFILGLTIHEFSHAWVADRLGDSTARRMGRLTLNPLAHLDLFGSLMLVFAGFGWAKPVPVDFGALRSPRRDMALIAVAGPVANVILAAALALALRALMPGGPSVPGLLPEGALIVFMQGIWINVILAVFNLIPVPPLDGSRIVAGLVPDSWNHGYEQFERIGPLLLLGLVLLASITGVSVLSRIIMPVANPVFKLVMGAWLYL